MALNGVRHEYLYIYVQEMHKEGYAITDKTQVIKGLVLMAAVAFDVYNKRPGHVSITKRLFNMNSAENKEGSPADKKS